MMIRGLRHIGIAIAVGLGGASWAFAQEQVSPDPEAAEATVTEEYDYGDFTSETLTTKAWKAQGQGDLAAAKAYVKKCIALYESKALQQSATVVDFAPGESAFNYWALNDVATSYFILGQILEAEGQQTEARQIYNTVITRFPYAQAWDPKGWFWKVAEAASDKLTTMGTGYDFGDYTSQTLTTRAWGASDQKDHHGVEIYTKKCIELYEKDAIEQQTKLTDYAPKGKAFNYWALNDVATSYFILGQSLMAQGRHEEAKVVFERVVNDFYYAQCWDPKGWFWKVAVASRGKINEVLALTGS